MDFTRFPSDDMRIVCIDGNIGAGKTSLLRWLRDNGYTVYEEALEAWGGFLTRYYRDKPRWAFTLQMAILASMLNMRDAISATGHQPKGDVVFVERSPTSALAFVRKAVEEGQLSHDELDVYMQFHNRLAGLPDVFVYLEAPIPTLLARIRQRDRAQEGVLDASYLASLNRHYEDVFTTLPDPASRVFRLETAHRSTDAVARRTLEHLDLLAGDALTTPPSPSPSP